MDLRGRVTLLELAPGFSLGERLLEDMLLACLFKSVCVTAGYSVPAQAWCLKRLLMECCGILERDRQSAATPANPLTKALYCNSMLDKLLPIHCHC